MIGPVGHVEITSDGVVKAAAGSVVSILLTAGSAAATLVLYDNAGAASGTVLATIKAPLETSESFTPPVNYVAANGIFADITGTGAAAYVLYL